jgi:pimeloyl-ACP methyl ester carboxylesterase
LSFNLNQKDIGMRKHTEILILVLIVSGCTFVKTDKSIPEGAKDGDLRLKHCVFKTKKNKYRADYGSLIVSENRQKNKTGLISLPVIRVHSLSKKPLEPIFYLAGGPGQSNMAFEPPDELLKMHDFVLIGYRGVDGSSKLDCPEVNKALRGKDRDLLGDASLRNLAKAYCDCANRLQTKDVDLDAYSMLDVTRDMESARMALGYGSINLLSQSYGTRIAQIYAYQNPGIIHSSVMVGVNPPGRFVWEPETIDHQIAYYNRLWIQDSICRIRSSDLTQTIRNVLENMPSHWLFFKIDPGKVKITTFVLLYHRNTAAQVFDTYILAEKGDPSGLALMTLAYNLMFPRRITWGDLAAKAISADYDSTRNYALEMDPPNSILGSPLSKLLWSLADWPTKTIPDEYRKVQHSSVPTLLLSGSVDFSTPAEYATNQLLPNLDNGKQVILKEMGHTNDLWNVQRSATVKLISNFFDTGLSNDSLFTYSPIDFSVSLGFPTIAKIGLAIVLLLFIFILFLIRSIIKRILRHKS